MPDLYDVAAIGNAIVDVIAPCDDAFLAVNGLTKGAMMLVDPAQSAALYAKMNQAVEASGGSAGNTIAGLASFGGKGAYMGKVADDELGPHLRARHARAGRPLRQRATDRRPRRPPSR
jgi:sugar/nucleoside kinase (ribokinase family)